LVWAALIAEEGRLILKNVGDHSDANPDKCRKTKASKKTVE